MATQRQPGLFDIEESAEKLTHLGVPRGELNARIDREAFRQDLNRVYDNARKSNADANPFDVVLMFKLRVLG